MFTFFLTATLALTLCNEEVQAAPEMADTVDIYVIDNEVVENFDGSKLVGMEIAEYKISRSKDKPMRVHSISTKKKTAGLSSIYFDKSTFSNIMNGVNVDSLVAKYKLDKRYFLDIVKKANVDSLVAKYKFKRPNKIVYIVDGKEVDLSEYFDKFTKEIRNKMSSIQVIRNKDIIKKLTEDESADMVIKIETK